MPALLAQIFALHSRKNEHLRRCPCRGARRWRCDLFRPTLAFDSWQSFEHIRVWSGRRSRHMVNPARQELLAEKHARYIVEFSKVGSGIALDQLVLSQKPAANPLRKGPTDRPVWSFHLGLSLLCGEHSER